MMSKDLQVDITYCSRRGVKSGKAKQAVQEAETKLSSDEPETMKPRQGEANGGAVRLQQGGKGWSRGTQFTVLAAAGPCNLQRGLSCIAQPKARAR